LIGLFWGGLLFWIFYNVGEVLPEAIYTFSCSLNVLLLFIVVSSMAIATYKILID